MIRTVIARRSAVLLPIVLLSLSFTSYADVAVAPAGPFSASGELAMKKAAYRCPVKPPLMAAWMPPVGFVLLR